jgi:predicted ArsR family transcriptional regulator
MDFFGERILAMLKGGEPTGFTVLLGEVGLSHNTLRQHLERLAGQGFVVREKAASNSFGRPRFAYHVPSRTMKQVTVALEDPQVELVALPFSRLRHVCRFEKGGYCKEAKKSCAPQICSQTRK